MSNQRILIIDDDDRLAALLAEYLTARGIAVDRRGDGHGGLAALRRGPYDAVVLDVMLPDLDGFEVLRRLRATSDVPVLMLTARGEETDRIVGLELGADDYLPKPFNPRELLARLRAVLRRARPGTEGRPAVLRFGRLEIDRDARVARLDGRPRDLTGHQFDLLLALAESAGRALSRDQLMEKVRGDALAAFDRSIDVHVSRIRAEIEDDPRHPRRILTLRGVGYLFTRDPEGG
ncbi:response regulator transcription factor [Myxococcota bacterium]|nr:response regulator transcription factor [Myxococcota bacterium]